jgi:hypothetical protein
MWQLSQLILPLAAAAFCAWYFKKRKDAAVRPSMSLS